MITKFCGNIVPRAYENTKRFIARFAVTGLIAPSQKALDKDTVADTSTNLLSDPRIQAQVSAHNLILPHSLSQVEVQNHHLGMCLQWLKEYRTSSSIEVAANAMSRGFNKTCEQASLLYQNLLTANQSQFSEADESRFVSSLKSVTAEAFGLFFSQECCLKMSAHKMKEHITYNLPPGEYLLSLGGYEVSAVKDQHNQIYLFDPDVGTVSLQDNPSYLFDPDVGTVSLQDNPSYLLSLLVKHKVHLKETLTLYTVQTDPTRESSNQSNAHAACDKVEVTSPEILEQAQLDFEKADNRWGTAVFTWRKNTHRFVIDNVRHDIYNDDPPEMVRCKCALLGLGTWLVAAGLTIYHVASLALHLGSLPHRAFQGNGTMGRTLAKVKRVASDVFRTPIYALLGTAAAFYGLIDPYEGRRIYNYFERRLHREIEGVNRKETQYLAECFIPLNFNIVDKQDKEKTIQQLKKAVLWQLYRNFSISHGKTMTS